MGTLDRFRNSCKSFQGTVKRTLRKIPSLYFWKNLCWNSEELSAGILIESLKIILGVIPRISQKGKLERSYTNSNNRRPSTNLFEETQKVFSEENPMIVSKHYFTQITAKSFINP